MKIAMVLHRTFLGGQQRTSPVEWWRVISPLQTLQKKYGWQIDTYTSLSNFDLVKNYDLVWFSYMDNILGFKALLDTGVPFVVDYDDDFFNLGAFNPVRREYPPDSLSYRSVTHIIKHAPHLVVSTQHLKRVYDKVRITPSVVMENRINPEAYIHTGTKVRMNQPITIGWMGGSTHYADLFHTPFWGALCFLAGKYPRLTFSAMGLYDDADYRDLPNFNYTEGSSDHPTFTKMLNRWINSVDICVAPLEDNLFNASKSSIKVQEYGIYGRPIVASNVRPYQEFNADSSNLIHLADTHKEWVDSLESLITDRRKREVEGTAISQFIKKSYTIDSVAEQYKDYIESIVAGKTYTQKARPLLKKNRLHIALGVRRFQTMTGSELYYYELAREFTNMGHQVTIVAHASGDPLVSKVRKMGIEVISTKDVATITPDVCIGSHDVMGLFVETFTATMLQVIHSENDYLWEIERPLPGVDHYIAVRESIRERAIKEGIHPDVITTIYNPIDISRFTYTKRNGKLLFVGPVDKLRKKVIKDLFRVANKKGLEVQLVGQDQPIAPTWDIEKYINTCEMTASIYMGRTTLEGWSARKAGLIYQVDGEGNILSKKIVAPQPLSLYDSKKVAERILSLC